MICSIVKNINLIYHYNFVLFIIQTVISVLNLGTYVSRFVNSLRPSFTPTSPFECNGKKYSIEVKKPGFLNRDPSYYFRIRTSDEEGMREVLRHIGGGRLQNLMASDKRVKSNKYVVFKTNKSGFEEIKQLPIIAPQLFKPKSRKLKPSDDVFVRYKHVVMGIPEIPATERYTKVPSYLKHLKEQRISKKPFFDITKKS